MTPGAGGGWTEVVLYSFDRRDGDVPDAGVTMDASGHLYGTTTGSGARGFGVVFQLAPGPNDTWTEYLLHRFNGDPGGAEPYAGVILDVAGNLYDTDDRRRSD